MQNITLHKEAWNSIFESISDGLIITDEFYNVNYINPEGEKITGWSLEHSMGKSLLNIFNLLNEIYQPVLPFFLNKVLHEPHVYEGISILINNDGKEILIKKTIKVIRREGNVVGYSLVFKNIGEERSKDQEQISNKRKFEGLFENSLEGILILDDDSNIIDANPIACEIFQIPRDEFIKLQVKNIFPHKSPEEADILWLEFLQQGQLEGKYKYILKEGGARYIDFKAKTNFLFSWNLAVFTDCTSITLLEKKLKRAQVYQQSYFQHTTLPLLLLDERYELVQCADAAKDFFKRKAPGNDVALWNLFLKNLQETLRARKSPKIRDHQHFEIRLGEDIVVCSCFSVKDGKGVKGFYVSLLEESTQHNGLEETVSSDLASSQKRFRSLAENSPDIIYIIDLKKREVIYFNRDSVFGYPSQHLELSDSWMEIVHPDDIEKVKNHWQDFLHNAVTTESIEYRLRRNDGTYEWVINRHTIVERNEKKEPYYVLLNITVITERKKAEEALRESEARLTALIENTTDIIWSVNNDFNLTAMNSSFKTLLKQTYKKNIHEGDNLLNSLPPKISMEWLQYHKRALNGERLITEFNINVKTHQLSYEISYNPIFNGEGVICGVSVFGRDITLRKSAENDIIRTNFELDSFVYRASHDLRAPLRSVLGLINIVKTEENEQQRNMYLNLVDKSVNKLDTFIADLTNFSRNSRLDIKIESINFSNIINECIDNLKYMDNASIIEIRTEINEKFEFWSDAGRISIILQNLLSNSIKYRNAKAAKSFVSIKVNVTKSYCEITFEDNGKGIKSEYLDKIFNMFFRASADSYGSGLGLYITKQVVEKLKGTIFVSSLLGSGSVFEIKLPNLFKSN